MAIWPDSPPNAAKCWPSDVLRAGSRRPWGLNRKSPPQIFRRFPRAPVGGLLVAVRAVSSLLFRFLPAICTSVGPLCARPQPRRDAGGPKERRSQGLRMLCGRFAPPVCRGRLFRAHQRSPSIASCSCMQCAQAYRLFSLHDCSSPAPAGTITVAVSAGTAIERLRCSAETRPPPRLRAHAGAGEEKVAAGRWV